MTDAAISKIADAIAFADGYFVTVCVRAVLSKNRCIFRDFLTSLRLGRLFSLKVSGLTF